MWIHATCQIDLQIPVETPFHFMLRPQSGWQQWVSFEQYELNPSVPVIEYTDTFGNLCQRIMAPAGTFSVFTSVDASCADASDIGNGAPFVEVQQLPPETLPFLLPSRYCESDRFGELASTIVSGVAAGYDQCATIVNYIRDTFQYAPGSGQDIISATEVNQRSQIVCRDMAHLGIALCRALSIPSRMVVGYLENLQPMDLHAWFEVYVGGRWYTFDPTQVSLQGGRIAIAYGRDAADVAIYSQYGEKVDILGMHVSVERISAPANSL